MSYRSRGASPSQSHAIVSKTLMQRTRGQKISKEKGYQSRSREPGQVPAWWFEEGRQRSGRLSASGHRVPSLRQPAEFSAEVTLKLLHSNEKSGRTSLI